MPANQCGAIQLNSLKTNAQRIPFTLNVGVGCQDTLHHHIPLLWEAPNSLFTEFGLDLLSEKFNEITSVMNWHYIIKIEMNWSFQLISTCCIKYDTIQFNIPAINNSLKETLVLIHHFWGPTLWVVWWLLQVNFAVHSMKPSSI